MDKRQLIELYDLVAVNWNLKHVSPDARQKALDVWWKYLGDVDYDKAVREVDRVALSGGYPPRPAELRVTVLAGPNLPPIPAEALAQAHALTSAIKSGVRIPQVHPLVAQTVEKYGLGRDDMFLRIYEDKRRDHLLTTYSDGGDMNDLA